MLPRPRRSTSGGQVAGLVLVVLGLAGCGESSDLPKLCPVKGRVVFKDRNINPALLAGGVVEFMGDSNTSAFGEIQEDGTVVLVSVVSNQVVKGARPGTYRARIAPPPEGWEGKARGAIHSRFGSFERSGLRYTVTEGGDNDFTMVVER